MASITIRKLSEGSKERLRRRAERSGLSLESLARSILDEAASEQPDQSPGFPHDLIAIVEPGDDIETHMRSHDHAQVPFDL